MDPKQPDALRRRVHECVAQGLDAAHGPINPTEYGPRIFDVLPAEEQSAFLDFWPAVIRELFAAAAREQTKGRGEAEASAQIDAFPLDEWISAARSGERVRYRHATWEDHQAHRERQLRNLLRTRMAFAAEEERRAQLRSVGMADDPSMTTEDAVALLRCGEAA